MRTAFHLPLPAGAAVLVFCLGCSGNRNHSSAPSFTTQPASQTVYALGTATFTVTAAGDPAPTFSWERSNDAGATWNPIPGATSAAYGFTVQATDNGSQFKAIASNPSATVASLPATLTEVTAVYAAGLARTSSTIPAIWVNGTAITPPGVLGQVNALAVNGTELLAGGYEYQNLVGSMPGYWASGQWLGLPMALFNGTGIGVVNALAASGTSIYAGGYNGDPLSNLAIPGYWLDGTLTSLPLPPAPVPVSGMVLALALSGSDLYAGGYINNGGTIQPALWQNGTWVSLSPTSSGMITCLAVANGNVYAGGSGGQAGPGYWLNGTWASLPLPADGTLGAVKAMTVAGSDVYAAGFYQNAGGYVPGYWLNGTWTRLPLPSGAGYGEVSVFVVAGGNVYAGGWTGTWSSSGDPTSAVPGYWLNGIWTALPVPATATYSYLNALVVVP